MGLVKEREMPNNKRLDRLEESLTAKEAVMVWLQQAPGHNTQQFLPSGIEVKGL